MMHFRILEKQDGEVGGKCRPKMHYLSATKCDSSPAARQRQKHDQSVSGCVEQGQQRPPAIKRYQVIASADMGLTNKNLRHGSPAGDFHHHGALGWLNVHPDFIELSDAALLEKLLGMYAIRAAAGGVNLDCLHGAIQKPGL
jgi:hypothetical protein